MRKKKTIDRAIRQRAKKIKRIHEISVDEYRKTPVGVRIEPSSLDFYEDNFLNITRGATFILEFFPVIYKRTIAELKGRFDSNDLRAIVLMMQFVDISAQHLGRGFVERLEESMIINEVPNQKPLSAVKETVATAKGLTAMQYAILELWAWKFWQIDWNEMSSIKIRGEILDFYVTELLAEHEEREDEKEEEKVT